MLCAIQTTLDSRPRLHVYIHVYVHVHVGVNNSAAAGVWVGGGWGRGMLLVVFASAIWNRQFKGILYVTHTLINPYWGSHFDVL